MVAQERAPTRSCFLHRDYQHVNMPGARERLTGVVDWSERASGLQGLSANRVGDRCARSGNRHRDVEQIGKVDRVRRWRAVRCSE